MSESEKDLVRAMDKYIDFLTDELDKLIHLQYVHGDGIVDLKKGKVLRDRIRELDVEKLVT